MSRTTANPYRFGGQIGYQSDVPGRQYVRARHLDTGKGRWRSRDPLGFGGGDANLYRYVKARPAVMTDPTGLQECPVQRPVCGPNVTRRVQEAMELTRLSFRSWSAGQKHAACYELVGYLGGGGGVAWDTVELKTFPWRPRCPSCSIPRRPCGDSVTVSGACFFAGSVNYVTFGVMMRLCFDWVGLTEKWKFKKDAMESLILAHKYGASWPNIKASLAWADAGYDGWPLVDSPTGLADRTECPPTCHCTNVGPRFTVLWQPIGILHW